jgi:hypothetical protein
MPQIPVTLFIFGCSIVVFVRIELNANPKPNEVASAKINKVVFSLFCYLIRLSVFRQNLLLYTFLPRASLRRASTGLAD